MVNTTRLQNAINASGVSIAFLAKSLSISRRTFYSRLKGKSDFRLTEIQLLSNVLRLNPEEKEIIFFN